MTANDNMHPGALILVVGPSGAGKDTLIALARDMIGPHDRVSFPRRIVTRNPSPAEDHDTMSAEDFDDAVERGAFAFWWSAHGLKYALGSGVSADIDRGVTVVCNVSRTVVPHLRRTFSTCRVVFVDAPIDMRAHRLRKRGRDTDGDGAKRLSRTIDHDLAADLVIFNDGDPRDGGRVLASIIMAEVGAGNAILPSV
jgi:ribose 1,5-bisphosphokinase